MLWDINKKSRRITSIPHAVEYRDWISNLTSEELLEIKEDILSRIEGDEVATAGWIPGSKWQGTPFYAIYEKACNSNHDAAAMCFGLIVWEVFMEHEDDWSFGRYSLNNVPIKSMTYFRIHF